MKYLALVAACLLTLGLVAPAEAGSADPVEVTFPEVTALNPDHTPYVLEIHDPQPELGELFARWGAREVALPHDGSATIPLSAGDGSNPYIYVVRCPAAGDQCVGTGQGRSVALVRSLGLRMLEVTDGTVGAGTRLPVEVSYPHFAEGDRIRLEWTVTDAEGGALVVQSAADWLVGDPMPIPGIPADTDAEQVRIAVHAISDSARWGELEGSVENEYWVDVVPPKMKASLSSDVVFPAPDGYLDYTRIQIGPWAGPETLRVDVVDWAGAVTNVYAGRADGIAFDGRNGDEPFPAGRYTLRVTGYDFVGNATVRELPVRVDDRLRVERTYRRTIPAARTLVDQYVGVCSHLGSAAGRGWKRSLGLYSTSPCAKEDGSVVATLHGAQVPASFGDYPSAIRLSLYGGAARGARSAYLVHGWLRNDTDWFMKRRTIRGGLGEHKTNAVTATKVVREIDGRRWVYWQVGLTDGSRYDIKSFTISTSYYRLVAPASRTASDAKTMAEPSGAPGPGYTPPKTEAALLLAAYSPAM